MKRAGYLFLAIFLLRPSLSFALDCEFESQALHLNLVSPRLSKYKDPVAVQWRLEDKILWVDFEVRVPVQSEKKVFNPKKDYPFQFDVVEVFLAVGDPLDQDFVYYEFEVTPNGQAYQVKISVKGTKKKFTDDILLGTEALGSVTARGWTGSFKIPLEKLGWSGDQSRVKGNFYAILGKKSERTYWSTFLPPQLKPNFHMPQFFQPLFKCGDN